jgi:Putative GTPase activating protein for Arf
MSSHPSAYAHQTSGNLREDGNFTAAGKGRVCIPTADKNLQFKKLKAAAANQVCFDCPAPRPTWASVTYGTFTKRAPDSTRVPRVYPASSLTFLTPFCVGDRRFPLLGLLGNAPVHGCAHELRSVRGFGRVDAVTD